MSWLRRFWNWLTGKEVRIALPQRSWSEELVRFHGLRIRSVDVELNGDAKTAPSFKTEHGAPIGVVVHYTAGRYVTNEEAAKRDLKDMAKSGYGAILIGTDGVMYAPKNWNFFRRTNHAGKSNWRGVNGLNDYCLGVEVACAGKLDEAKRSWFRKQYKPDEIREENGEYWHRFTHEQEAVLKSLILFLAKNIPGFDPEFVVGHHEISAGRKVDPGGSLSMEMWELRSLIKDRLGK